MKILGLDFETTGLSPETDLITEVGAVLWDTVTKSPIRVASYYINWVDLKELDPVITEITGITLDTLRRYGVGPVAGLATLLQIMGEADAVAAHNGEAFDRPFFEAYFRKCADKKAKLPSLTWIDTQNDIPYPESIKTRKLVHLAAEHGFLNPFAHRAVFDVLTMLKVLECYDADAVLELARQPNVCLAALVSYGDRALASGRGYRWHGASKTWWRTFKESQIAKEKAECGFPVRVITRPKE